MIEAYTVDTIVNCARCGETHTQVEARPFTKRTGRHTHFAACPTNGEPILFYSTNEPQMPGEKLQAIMNCIADIERELWP